MATSLSPANQTTQLLQAYYGLEELYAAFDRAASELAEAKSVPLCIEACGKCCEVNTPYIWEIEGHHIISTIIGDGNLHKTMDRCVSWLLDRHRGLTLYGHRVDPSEAGKAKVLHEVAVTAATACPFLDPDKRCAIHEVRPLACRAYAVTRLPSQTECAAPLGPTQTESTRGIYLDDTLIKAHDRYLASLKPEWRHSYFLPTELYRLFSLPRFTRLVDRIATAKTVVFPISPAVIWQHQLEAQWAGMGVR